jgi:hypothetical protein
MKMARAQRLQFAELDAERGVHRAEREFDCCACSSYLSRWREAEAGLVSARAARIEAGLPHLAPAPSSLAY